MAMYRVYQNARMLQRIAKVLMEMETLEKTIGYHSSENKLVKEGTESYRAMLIEEGLEMTNLIGAHLNGAKYEKGVTYSYSPTKAEPESELDGTYYVGMDAMGETEIITSPTPPVYQKHNGVVLNASINNEIYMQVYGPFNTLADAEAFSPSEK